MTRINRKTETKGFLFTSNDFIEFETTYSVTDARLEIKDEEKFLVDTYLTKKEVELLRDFFAHTAKYMED